MVNWTDQYIDLPFAFDGRTRTSGVDCWGLVRLVYREQLGIDLPALDGALADHSLASLRRVHQAATIESARWIKVARPAPFDVVLLRRGAVNCHVGTVARPGWMLHVEQGCNAVVEPYNGLTWGQKVAGYYHYDR